MMTVYILLIKHRIIEKPDTIQLHHSPSQNSRLRRKAQIRESFERPPSSESFGPFDLAVTMEEIRSSRESVQLWR